MEKGNIGIIVPVYNSERYLKKCIRSILKQTYKNFRVIIVDDGSTDFSGKICDDFAKADSKIHVIHQKNRGLVETRKVGVLSSVAQSMDYLTFVDADDILDKFALEKMYNIAKKYNADCVCGNKRRQWKNIKFSTGYKLECLKSDKETVYNTEQIIKKLYISCFGITNYPVTLWGKLYKTELITDAIDFAPVVRFMGEDLSVTLRCMPITERLVIIPDVIYNYRIGGGTSKFMKDMLNEFIALYEFKSKLAVKYPMPQDSEFYMNVELMNVVMSWLLMCYKKGGYKNKKLEQECLRVCKIQTIKQAAQNLKDRNNKIADLILQQKVDELEKMILERVKQTRKTDIIKKVLSLFG